MFCVKLTLTKREQAPALHNLGGFRDLPRGRWRRPRHAVTLNLADLQAGRHLWRGTYYAAPSTGAAGAAAAAPGSDKTLCDQ